MKNFIKKNFKEILLLVTICVVLFLLVKTSRGLGKFPLHLEANCETVSKIQSNRNGLTYIN